MAKVESQQPFWRDGRLPVYDHWKERKRSSKKSLHDEEVGIEAMSGTYSNVHLPENLHKKLTDKYSCAAVQQETKTEVKKVLHNEVSKVSSYLDKLDETNDGKPIESPRHTRDNLYRIQSYATEAGAKPNLEILSSLDGMRLQKPGAEDSIAEQLAPVNCSISPKQGRSRRTKKHNQTDSTAKLLERIPTNKEPSIEAFADALPPGKPTMPAMVNEVLLESAQKGRAQPCNGIVKKTSDGLEVKNGHEIGGLWKSHKQSADSEDDDKAADVKQRGWHLGKVSPIPSSLSFSKKQPTDDLLPSDGAEIFNAQVSNGEDYREANVKQKSRDSERCSPSSFRLSKPPDRPPPPVPPYKVTSLPSRQTCSSPPVVPKRSVTLGTSHVRGSLEPHVHPKLPEYEELVASFAALKKKPCQPPPHSSSRPS